MATKTYGERRQETYFRAAIEMYRLVIAVAEENIVNPPEGAENVSDANLIWAASLIETTFKKGDALEQLGHEETVATPRWNNRLARERASAHRYTAEGKALIARILEQVKK